MKDTMDLRSRERTAVVCKMQESGHADDVRCGLGRIGAMQVGTTKSANGLDLAVVKVGGTLVMESPIGGDGVFDLAECDVYIVPRKIVPNFAGDKAGEAGSLDKLDVDLAGFRE